jgi:hypothetical protein
MPKVVRIVGADGAMAWMQINQLKIDPFTGEASWENDITASEADFIVDETDYRETVRMAQSEMLFEMVGRMPPNVAMALLDIAVEMTDLPNKQALAARIRAVTGQQPMGKENTPEAQQAAAAKQQADAQAQATAQAQADAEVELTKAKAAQAQGSAALSDTRAKQGAVDGKANAMRTASMVAGAPNLAPAADRLWDPAEAFPAPPNQFITAQ